MGQPGMQCVDRQCFAWNANDVVVACFLVLIGSDMCVWIPITYCTLVHLAGAEDASKDIISIGVTSFVQKTTPAPVKWQQDYQTQTINGMSHAALQILWTSFLGLGTFNWIVNLVGTEAPTDMIKAGGVTSIGTTNLFDAAA